MNDKQASCDYPKAGYPEAIATGVPGIVTAQHIDRNNPYGNENNSVTPSYVIDEVIINKEVGYYDNDDGTCFCECCPEQNNEIKVFKKEAVNIVRPINQNSPSAPPSYADSEQQHQKCDDIY